MKIGFGIVLGIVFIVSIPREAFQIKYWRQRGLGKVDDGEADVLQYVYNPEGKSGLITARRRVEHMLGKDVSADTKGKQHTTVLSGVGMLRKANIRR